MKQQEQGRIAGFEEEYLCYADASFLFVCMQRKRRELPKAENVTGKRYL